MRDRLSGRVRSATDQQDDDVDLAPAAAARDPGKGPRLVDLDDDLLADSPASGWSGVARKAEPDAPDVDGALAHALGEARDTGGGEPLPPALRAALEESIGVDLTRVRLHTDARAARAAAQIGARAFTIGTDVYFAQGAYAPTSDAGCELIAHEIAHVAQNLRGERPASDRAVAGPGDPSERAADDFARRFTYRVDRTPTDAADMVEHVRAAATRVDIPGLAELEQELGADLGHVQVYTGQAAVEACKWMQATAFAVHNIVAFADPSPKREQLLHELAHVVQSGARAPARFFHGSLAVADHDAPAEHDARGAVGGAPIAAKVDAGTIHRDDKKPEKSPEDKLADILKQWKKLIADTDLHPKLNLSKASAGEVTEQASFGKKWGKGYKRYKKTSKKAIFLEMYFAANPGLDRVKCAKDLQTLHDSTKQGEAKIYKVGDTDDKSGRKWAWIDDAGAAEPIVDLESLRKKDPDHGASFRSVCTGVLALQKDTDEGGPFLTAFTEVKVEGLDDPIPLDPKAQTTYGADEAEACRKQLREAIVAETKFHYKEGTAWEVFLKVVSKKGRFEQGLQGQAFGLLVEKNLGDMGYTLKSKEVAFAIDKRFQSENFKRRGDGFSTQGENTIVEFKSGAKKTLNETDDEFKQAQDYYLMCTGIDHTGKKGKKPVVTQASALKSTEFVSCVYNFTTPEIAKGWAPALRKAFHLKKGEADNPVLKIFPPVDGTMSVPVTTNPTFQIPLKDTSATTHVIPDPFFHPGLKVSKATIKTKAAGSSELAEGSTIEMQSDLGSGAKAEKEAPKPIKPGSGPGGTFDGKLANVKTGLDKILKRIKPDVRITDSGVEGELVIEKGPSGLPKLDLEGKVTVKYGNDGNLSAKGSVTLAKTDQSISATVTVEYVGGAWKLTGTVTLKENLIVDGLGQIVGTIEYTDGKWKVGLKEASYKRTFGQITLTGKVEGAEYDFTEEKFSGYVELDADLGMFGRANGSAEFKNNKLAKAQLSYDSPEFKYPKGKGDPALKGTVGGTLTYNDGKFGGKIRGSANINVAGLKKVAGDEGLGLNVNAEINDDGSYSGSISTTTPLSFGKHLVIPAPLTIKLEKDGSLSGAFSIKVQKLKWLDDASISCSFNKDGIKVEAFHVEKAFGAEAKNKFWGKLVVDYTDEKGLNIEGTANYKIKEGMVATGKIKYDNKTHLVSLHMEISKITLLDSKIDKKTLFSVSKKIPVINIYGLGVYIDVGFDLAFDMGFSLGLKPELDFKDFSLETGEFTEIAAKMTLFGNIFARLIGTPKIGLGIFVLSPSLLAGGGGLKMPITGRADINPTGVIELKYSPTGGVTGAAAFDMNMTFGIEAELVPYAEFDVLSGLWNPKWEGKPITKFPILPKKELFKLHVDLAGDMTTKKDPPATAEKDAAPPASGKENDEKFKQKDEAPAAKDDGRTAPKPVKADKSPDGGEDGQFSLGSLLEKLKTSVPEVATAEKIFNIAKKVWKIIEPIYDVAKPLIDLIGKRIDAFIDLFTTELPESADDALPWLWKCAKKVLNIAFGGIVDFVDAIWTMLGKAIDLAKKLVNSAVDKGYVGVKRHSYYIWMPWPKDNIEFMAASQYKLHIPGVINDDGGPRKILLVPSAAVAFGLNKVLGVCGVDYTYTGLSDINEPYNDRWRGADARG